METFLTDITDYLIHQSWQVALLVILIALSCRFLRHVSAHWRYLLWLLVVAKCLVPPLLNIPLAVLPPEQKSIINQPSDTSAPIAAESFIPSFPASDNAFMNHPTLTTPHIISSPDQEPITLTLWSQLSDLTLKQQLGLGWLAGVIFYLLIALIKAARIDYWLRRNRRPLTDSLQTEYHALLYRHQIKQTPRVWLMPQIAQPFVWGMFRGDIYLPVDFVQARSAQHRREVLMHEIMHVLRFDAFVNILQIIAQGLFFFHPLVWWANNRIRREREKCCDEMALARLASAPQQYGWALIDSFIKASKSSKPVPSLAIAGPVKNIEERIKTIMKPDKKFYRRPTLINLIIVLLLAGLTVPFALALTNQEHVVQVEGLGVDEVDKEVNKVMSLGRIQTQSMKVFEGQFELDKDIPVELDLGKVYDWMLVSARSIRFERSGADVNVHFKMDVRRGFEFNWRTRIMLLDGEGTILGQQIRDSRSGKIDFIYMSGQSPVEDRELKLLPFSGLESAEIERFRVYVEPLGSVLDNLGREIYETDQDLIQGRVLDPEGKPIVNAVVKIAEDNMWSSDNVALVATDEQGRFKLKTVSWPYKFAVQWRENLPNEKWGRFQHMLLEQVYEGPQPVDIQFEEFPRGKAELSGQLIDQEGNPITEYSVIVSKSYKNQELLNTVGPQQKHLWWFTLDAEVSSEDGTFQLKNLPAGDYLILAHPDHETYEWPNTGVTLQDGKTTTEVIIAPSKNTYYGRVLFEDGTPVFTPPPWPGAKTSVTIWRLAMGTGVGSVDADGYFKISLEARDIENLKSGISYLGCSFHST